MSEVGLGPRDSDFGFLSAVILRSYLSFSSLSRTTLPHSRYWECLDFCFLIDANCEILFATRVSCQGALSDYQYTLINMLVVPDQWTGLFSYCSAITELMGLLWLGNSGCCSLLQGLFIFTLELNCRPHDRLLFSTRAKGQLQAVPLLGIEHKPEEGQIFKGLLNCPPKYQIHLRQPFHGPVCSILVSFIFLVVSKGNKTPAARA